MISAVAARNAGVSSRCGGNLIRKDSNIIPSNTSSTIEVQRPQCENHPPSYVNYPSRIRALVSQSSTEDKLDHGHFAADKRKPLPAVRQRNSDIQSHGQDAQSSYSGVSLGSWRDSNVPDDARKHSVVGWLDARDRLRTRIIPMTREGESLADSYPLPSGTGSIWVKFESIVFSDHLVGLNQFEIKEYTRIRSTAGVESTQQLRTAAENGAVAEAVRRVKASGLPRKELPPPSIAKGPNAPHFQVVSTLPDSKRRKLTDRFVSIRPALASGMSDQASSPRAASPRAASPRADPLKSPTFGRTTEQFSELQSSTAGPYRVFPPISRASESDIRVYDRTKYIRQNKGPFSGKLVSEGTIIIIDGEEYVEYRVLTKPLFF